MNRTLWRTVVTGPEDPKLTLFPSSFATAGESGAVAQNDRSGVVRLVFGSMPPAEGGGCGKYNGQPKYQMFQTSTPLEVKYGSDGQYDGQDLGYRSQGVKSECGDDSQHEKNWIAFVDGDKLRYVQAVSDHLVKTQDAQGQCSVRDTWGRES